MWHTKEKEKRYEILLLGDCETRCFYSLRRNMHRQSIVYHADSTHRHRPNYISMWYNILSRIQHRWVTKEYLSNRVPSNRVWSLQTECHAKCNRVACVRTTHFEKRTGIKWPYTVFSKLRRVAVSRERSGQKTSLRILFNIKDFRIAYNLFDVRICQMLAYM